ncbi:replication initiator protein A [Deinococcus sonorensis]|uniref:Replication initiator protein A n=2 Tax=Deinococcus sonorensis TaxID=309891 RepID=A0AAU7U4T1_9DEIO
MTLETSREKHAFVRPFDELNLARLSLISMQSRVGRDQYGWEDAYLEGGKPVSVKCVGTVEYLIPHGIDNDVMIGIQNMFLAAGCPASNAVTDTAGGYLRWAGLDRSGRYYRNLRESLMRLSHTNYHVERGWYSGNRFQTVIFRHLHEISFDTGEAGGGLDSRSLITVVLPTPIAESLRRGFIKPLDAQVLAVLEQPATRALYRLLDGSRHDPNRPNERLNLLQTNLVVWARRARILDLRPTKIRRTLDAAHEELIQARYLSAVEYNGRGANTTITYIFAHDIETSDPELYDRLAMHGIAPKMIRELIQRYGNVTVRERLDEAETLSKGKRQPGAGFFVAFIRSPEEYRPRAVVAPGSSSPRQAAQPVLLALPKVEEPDPDARAREQWETMSHSERVRETMRVLRITYGSRFSGGQYEAIRDALEVGAFRPEVLKNNAARALNEGRRDELAAELRMQVFDLNQS